MTGITHKRKRSGSKEPPLSTGMTGRLLLQLLVLLAAATLSAADDSGAWRFIRADGRVAVFLDAAAAVPAEGVVRRTTVKRLFASPDERAYALDTLEIDCGADTFRYLNVVLYDRDGYVVNRYTLSDQPAQVPAASYLATVRNLVCGRSPSPPTATSSLTRLLPPIFSPIPPEIRCGRMATQGTR